MHCGMNVCRRASQQASSFRKTVNFSRLERWKSHFAPFTVLFFCIYQAGKPLIRRSWDVSKKLYTAGIHSSSLTQFLLVLSFVCASFSAYIKKHCSVTIIIIFTHLFFFLQYNSNSHLDNCKQSNAISLWLEALTCNILGMTKSLNVTWMKHKEHW